MKSIQQIMNNFGLPATETTMGFLGWKDTVCSSCGKNFRYALTGYRNHDGSMRMIGEPQTLCPECRLQAEHEKMVAAFWEGKAHELLADAQIPPIFIDSSFKNFECYDPAQETALVACGFVVNKTYRNLLIYGRADTGKTRLLCATVRAFCELGAKAKYITEHRLLQMIKDGYSPAPGQKSATVITSELANIDCLAIDEVGRSRWSETDQQNMMNIINVRYDNRRPTLIATNLTPQSFDDDHGHTIGLDEYYGDALARRLLEDCAQVMTVWKPYHTIHPRHIMSNLKK